MTEHLITSGLRLVCCLRRAAVCSCLGGSRAAASLLCAEVSATGGRAPPIVASVVKHGLLSVCSNVQSPGLRVQEVIEAARGWSRLAVDESSLCTLTQPADAILHRPDLQGASGHLRWAALLTQGL